MEDDPELAELLREQEAFRASGRPAAATVVRTGAQRIPKARTFHVQGSGAGERSESKQSCTSDGHTCAEPLLPTLNPDVFKSPPIQQGKAEPPLQSTRIPASEFNLLPPEMPEIPVMSDILERPSSLVAPRFPSSQGFPQAVHRSQLSASARSRLTRTKTKGPVPLSGNESRSDPSRASRPTELPPGASRAEVSLQSQIDAENRAKISNMTHKEILQAQQQLERTLGPALAAVRSTRKVQAGDFALFYVQLHYAKANAPFCRVGASCRYGSMCYLAQTACFRARAQKLRTRSTGGASKVEPSPQPAASGDTFSSDVYRATLADSVETKVVGEDLRTVAGAYALAEA
eukprot:2866669-Pleurochrysis_carterae.AAC.1